MEEKKEMSIEQIIEEIGVKRILIVDDTPEHIEAAKKAYIDYKSIIFDYASGEQETKQKIFTAYEKGEKYDYIITDMEMEKKDSGKEVLRYASEKLTFGAVLTRTFHGAVSEQEKGQKVALISPFGPLTEKFDSILQGPYIMDTFMQDKSEPELWKKALEWGLYRTIQSTCIPKEWMKIFKEKYDLYIKEQKLGE